MKKKIQPTWGLWATLALYECEELAYCADEQRSQQIRLNLRKAALCRLAELLDVAKKEAELLEGCGELSTSHRTSECIRCAIQPIAADVERIDSIIAGTAYRSKP